MKLENKIRNALISLYWEAHSDGRLCEKHDGILEHINSIEWANRRAKVINVALQKLNLPNAACSRRVPRRGAKVVKSKSVCYSCGAELVLSGVKMPSGKIACAACGTIG